MGEESKETIYRSMKRLYKNYVRMARRRNVFWEISIELFAKLTSSECAYCGAKPAQISRAYRYNGLDRKDHRKGYLIDNVVPSCKECNWIKGRSLSYDEMK